MCVVDQQHARSPNKSFRVDLSQPVNGSINRAEPTWQSNLLNLYLETVDAFIKYDNLLAFTVGNEVVSDENSTIAAPFIKAAARDVKAYLCVAVCSEFLRTIADIAQKKQSVRCPCDLFVD